MESVGTFLHPGYGQKLIGLTLFILRYFDYSRTIAPLKAVLNYLHTEGLLKVLKVRNTGCIAR